MATTERIDYIFTSDSSGMKNASDGMNKVDISAKSVFQTFTKITTVLAAITGMGDVLGKAVGRVDTINSAKTQLGLMFNDMSKGQEVADGLSKAIAGTPIAMDQVIENAKKLVGAGMEADKVTESFQAIADVSFGDTEKIDNISRALQKMYTQGKLSGDVIQSLADAGVPALKILANEGGVSVDEMSKKISSGALSSQDAMDMLIKGIENGTDGLAGKTVAYAGMAVQAGQTIEGAYGNMRTAIVRNTANIIEPLQGPLVGALNALSVAVDAVGSKLQVVLAPAIQFTSGVINDITEKLGLFADGLNKVEIGSGFFEDFKNSVQQFFNDFQIDPSGLIAPLVQGFALAGGEILALLPGFNGAILSSIGGLGVPLVGVLSGIIANLDFQGLISSFIATLQTILPPILALFSTISGAFFSLGEALAPVVNVFLQSFMSVLSALAPVILLISNTVFDLSQTLITALSPIMATLQGVFTLLAEQLIALMPVFEQIVTVVGFGLQEILAALGPIVEQLMASLMPILQEILPVLAEIVAELVANLAPIITEIVGLIIEMLPTILPILQTIIEAVGRILIALMPLVTTIISSLMPVISSLMPMIAEIVAQIAVGLIPIIEAVVSMVETLVPIILPIIETIIEAVGNILEAVMPLILMLIEQLMPVIATLIEAITPVIAIILEVVGIVIATLMPVITTIIQILVAVLMPTIAVVIAIIKVVINVVKFVANIISAVLQVAIQAIMPVINVFKTVLGKLGDAFVGLGNFIADVVKKITDLFDWVGKAGSAVGDFASKLNPFKNFIGGNTSFEILHGNINPGGTPVSPGEENGLNNQTNNFNYYVNDIVTARNAYRQTQELRNGGVFV